MSQSGFSFHEIAQLCSAPFPEHLTLTMISIDQHAMCQEVLNNHVPPTLRVHNEIFELCADNFVHDLQ